MQAIFIESGEFTEWVSEYLPDEEYLNLQQELMNHPQKGDLIPGCGGLRKVRTRDPRRRRGKRGGARVIYLYLPDVKWFFLLDIYGKNEKDDLNAAEKKELRTLATEFKKHARMAARRRNSKEQ